MQNLDWLNELGQAMTRGEQICTDMPRHDSKMSGRLEAPEYAMSRLSRHAPTQNNVQEMENKKLSAPGEVGGQEINCAAKTVPVHPLVVVDQTPQPNSEKQSQGYECGSCHNLNMMYHAPTAEQRRLFQWVCKAKHKPLAVGYGSERVLIAPPECQDWKRWQQPAR